MCSSLSSQEVLVKHQQCLSYGALIPRFVAYLGFSSPAALQQQHLVPVVVIAARPASDFALSVVRLALVVVPTRGRLLLVELRALLVRRPGRVGLASESLLRAFQGLLLVTGPPWLLRVVPGRIGL